MLPIYDLSTAAGRVGFAQTLDRLRHTASLDSEAATTVAATIADVRDHGDEAVVRSMRQWTDPDYSRQHIRVRPDEMAAAADQLDPQLRQAISAAIDHVRQYQQHIKPVDAAPITIGGAELGLRFTAVDSVGLTVPGGAAVLFSSLIMLAVPAQVAGVDSRQIAVVNPPPTRHGDESAGDISPIVMATCAMLGIEKLYRIGGAAAVAALALGTTSVGRVELIAGPGNIYSQLAKAQLAGHVGTDGGFYGPSEIATIADDTADPAYVAADLIAQAEHDPGKCFLVAWSSVVIDRVIEQIEAQLRSRKRRGAIAAALRDESCAVLAADRAQAVEVINTIACEHVNLAVADADAMLGGIRHAGEVFLGHQTPVAAGDYYAGPSHCLPTGSTARFASGVSVYTFLKRTGTIGYRQPMAEQVIDHIVRLADAEGLDGHAESARLRRQ